MSEELEGAQGGSQEAGKPGQPEGQEVPARQSEGTAEPDPRQRPVNLDELPEFRQWKSTMDRRIAELTQQVQAAQREKSISEARAQQMLRAIENVDPDAGQQLVQAARLAEMEAELESYRLAYQQMEQQREIERRREEWRRQQEALAARKGLDPHDPRFQAAINEALRTGSGDPVLEALIEMTAEKQRSGTRAPAEPPEGAEAGHSALPPAGGGAAVSQRDRLLAEFKKRKSTLRPGDVDGLAALRKEYLGKGLSRADVYDWA